MIIEKMLLEKKTMSFDFTIEKNDDKEILKQILENFEIICFQRLCNCQDQITNLEQRRYLFTYCFDTKKEVFKEIK